MRNQANNFPNQHGLHFQKPVQTWDEAIPLGNGIMGALLWGDGLPLRISLDRADLWDLRKIPEYHSDEYSFSQMQAWHLEGRIADLERVYEAPYQRPSPTKISAGRIEIELVGAQFLETKLDLENAIGSMTWQDGTRAEVFLMAVEPVGCIYFSSTQKLNLRLLAPKFNGEITIFAQNPIQLGDLAQLNYPNAIWEQSKTSQGFVQEATEGFKFAVYLAWQEHNGHLFAAWSVASSFEQADVLALAKNRVEKILDVGFEAAKIKHGAWWQKYWQQSAVTLPNKLLERQWYLEQYKFGAAARRGAPPITLQGPWTADDGRLPPWKGDYHHDLNTQLSYWLCYSSNHLEEGLGFLDWLWDTRAQCFAWTKRFYGMDGLNVPMTADLHNNQIGGWRQYTHMSTTSAWLAHHFYLHWRYSMDRNFLETRAFVYLSDVATFLDAMTSQLDVQGLRTLPLSASPEINNNSPEAWFSSITNYDLSLITWLFMAAIELATELGRTEPIAAWQRVLSQLPALAQHADKGLLIAANYPLPHSHRHFSHLISFHPLGLINWNDGLATQSMMSASLGELEVLGTSQWCGYSFSWIAGMYARALNGRAAEQNLEIFCKAFTLQNSFHCNGDQSGLGHSLFTLRPFTLEGNFAAAAGIQEMLLQSQAGLIQVFPAIPASWANLSFWRLRAEGAILVSAERKNGVTISIELQAEQDCTARLLSPFTNQVEVLTLKAGQVIRLA